jgi:hypothetical protein
MVGTFFAQHLIEISAADSEQPAITADNVSTKEFDAGQLVLTNCAGNLDSTLGYYL